MTTRVTIKNEGPGYVQVIRQENWSPAGDAAGPTWMETKYRSGPLAPGVSEEFWCHRNQRVIIEEIAP